MFKKLLFVAILVSLVATAFSMPIPKLQNGNCPNSPARLKQSDIAVVTVGDGETLNLRVQPNLNADRIVKIPAYTYVTIIAGPICDGGYRWYEVGWEGKDGWSAEVGPDGEYNMIPNGQPVPTNGNPVPNGNEEVPWSPPHDCENCQTQQSDVWPDVLIGEWKGKIECNINMLIRPCEVDVVITRAADGSLELSVMVDSEVINSSSQQRIYKESWAKPGRWGYIFILYRKGFKSFAEIDLTNDNEIYFWDYGQDSEGTSEFGDLTRVSEPVITPTETSQPLIEAPIVPTETEQEEPSWWCANIGWFCVSEAIASDDTNTECNPQCVTEARSKRPDLAKKEGLWSYNTSTAKQIYDAASSNPVFILNGQVMQVRVRDANEAPEANDIVIWPKGCGDNSFGIVTFMGGHIGTVQSYNDGNLIIHDANWNNNCGIRNEQVTLLSCMQFITSPYPSTQPQSFPPGQTQSTNTCVQYDWPQSLFCEWGLIK